MNTPIACTLAVMLCGGSLMAQRGDQQPEPDSPTTVIRSLVRAIYGNDVASYNNLTLPHPMRSRLTTGGSVNANKLRELTQDPGSLQLRQERPLLFQGKEAALGANGQYPEGTTALYMAAHGGQPMVVGLVRRPEGWKVDLRWWIAMTDRAMGKDVARDSPERVIRALLASMLRLDRNGAAGFLTDSKQIDALFAGAPSQREPSGVLDATVGEMPLVEIGPGEFYPLPTNHIVEGSQAGNRKVIVGWFGPVEIPFVLRRVGSNWRVEAAPYFILLNR